MAQAYPNDMMVAAWMKMKMWKLKTSLFYGYCSSKSRSLYRIPRDNITFRAMPMYKPPFQKGLIKKDSNSGFSSFVRFNIVDLCYKRVC